MFLQSSRRFIVPEIVQTSAMDCGPAALKCLLAGFRIKINYGRLREACQTDVDGTSIDSLETLAVQLGLDAEQIMLPIDHLFLASASALPAIIVVRHPNGNTHFVVAWQQHGRFMQIMDPATGRRWPTCQSFLQQLYIHNQLAPATTWREWAGTSEFCDPLSFRLYELGIPRAEVEDTISRALEDTTWHTIALLDAATRMTASVVQAGGVRKGHEAKRVLEQFCLVERANAGVETKAIPANYWSVRPALPDEDGVEQVMIRGVVLIRARGQQAQSPTALAEFDQGQIQGSALLSSQTVATLAEKPDNPIRTLIQRLCQDGLITPATLVLALAGATGALLFEILLLRSMIDLSRQLSLSIQRLEIVGMMAIFIFGLLITDFCIMTHVLRWGRKFETSLRLAFLEKIPQLADHYFRSRLISDLAERSHSLHHVRLLPYWGERMLRAIFTLVFTTAGIIWLAPNSAAIAVLAATLAIGLPLATQPLLLERDFRVRNHLGALSRFYLDALLGLVTIRAHGAERAIRREQEGLVVEWAQARHNLHRSIVILEALQSTLVLGLVIWLLLDQLYTSHIGNILLLTYWALNLPVLGQEIAQLARQFPLLRNVTLRLLEPLGTPIESDFSDKNQTPYPKSAECLEQSHISTCPQASPIATSLKGVALCLEDVGVRIANHSILENINLTITPGTHVAIVGPSGAGKSTLVGLLLGWQRTTVGEILVDGKPFNSHLLEQLRRETAWIDPGVQLWNRSLLDNLRYGNPHDPDLLFGEILEQANLQQITQGLTDGLQTRLGEGGGFLSGGEGQRVRLGRSLLRPNIRLAILDEPFRGLDRQQRHELLCRTRRWWQQATLLCITHDIAETLTFDCVVVVEDGRVVEIGAPADLAAQPASRYQAMLQSEKSVWDDFWANTLWRRLRLEHGSLSETDNNGMVI